MYQSGRSSLREARSALHWTDVSKVLPFAKPRAVLFDAYGTLFDVHSVVLRAGAGIGGNLQALSQLWRQKQLEYTWLRALMRRYEDFWNVTEAALRSASLSSFR